MLSGTATVVKCVSVHFIPEQLPHLVFSIVLGFHALTDCDAILSLSGKGNNSCWQMFTKYAHLPTRVVSDDNVEDAWAFVCSLVSD